MGLRHRTKRDLYQRHGLRELWLAVTAGRTLLVYRRGEPQSGFDVQAELTAEQTVSSPLLPGFAVPVGDPLPTLK